MTNNLRIPSLGRFPLEMLLLAAFVFAVPAFEAPKNLLWLAYALTWLANRIRQRDFGGPWDGWDTLIAVWLASGYVVAAFAGLHGNEWGGANDMLRYLSILWLIKRSGYGRPQLMLVLTLTVAGTLAAVAEGLWRLYGTHENNALQLNSVGHVNHSAIYVAITFGAALSALLARWRRLTISWRLLGGAAVLLLGAAIVISASRGAVGATALFVLVLGLAWLRRSRSFAVLLLAGLLAVSAAVIATKPEVIKKQERDAQANNVLSFRDAIWRVAFEAWRHNPVFGVGVGNYNQISEDKVKSWLQADKRPYDPAVYVMAPHAHSLFMTALAERGLVGITPLLFALGAWLYALLHHLPGRDNDDAEWALWGGALSAWTISVVVGPVNTTLHHEHAILSVLLLGLWLAYRKAK